LKKVDVGQLGGVADERWDAVVWISPEPLLYQGAAESAFKKLFDRSGGLLVIGLAHDEPGRKALFKALAQRGAPGPGVHLEKHLEQSNWIWTAKFKDESHV